MIVKLIANVVPRAAGIENSGAKSENEQALIPVVTVSHQEGLPYEKDGGGVLY